MEIGRGTEAKDRTDKEESENNAVFYAVTYVWRGSIELARGGCDKQQCAEEMGKNVHGLVVEIAETGDGFPMIV